MIVATDRKNLLSIFSFYIAWMEIKRNPNHVWFGYVAETTFTTETRNLLL